MNVQLVRPMSARLLRSALVANAIFSSVCAIAFLAAARPIADLCGVAPAEIVSTGAGLVVFVGLLLVVITRRDLTRGWALGLAILVAALDVLWVLGTPISVRGYNAGGKGLLAGIAVVVGLLAALQIRALIGILRDRARSVVV